MAEPSVAELKEILAGLEALDYQRTYRQFFQFRPYTRQKDFLDAGAAFSERLLIAGNQNGKCVSYRTLIQHPDGTSTQAGALFDRGQPFEVKAWHAGGWTAMRVTEMIRKPAEPVVRINLADGQWFECALNHRVLTYHGYAFVGSLLACVPYLPATSSDIYQSVRALGARRWFGTASGWIARCFAGLRRYGEPLPVGATADPGALPSRLDVQTHSHPGSRVANSPCAGSVHHSNLDGRRRRADLSALFLIRDACRFARRTKSIRQAARLLSTAAGLGLRSALAELSGQFAPVALPSPESFACNKIVSYSLIGSQQIYDFTVPVFHNYIAAGVVHHNTHVGAYEAACHLTGLYPEDWKGRRFEKPTRGWIAGETSLVVRDVQQKKLCGEPGVDSSFGTGMIPRDLFADKPSLARGITDAYDTIQVKHVSGGVSVARFKSYEQGRQKFQGETLDWLWFDEEPPLEIYSEGLTRTAATRGITFMTFTPLQGPTAVVLRFLDEPSPYRRVITMTIDDAEHIPADEKMRLISSWPAHEREARAKGVPMLGSGRIFTSPEDSVTEDPIETGRVPAFWYKLGAVDFGIDHPFGYVLILWDKDADVIHVHHTYRVRDALPIQHAAAIRRVAAAVPTAWPVDGNIRRDDGKPMADHYKRHGVKMLPSHATWPDGSVSTEAGVLEIDEREQSGRMKYSRILTDLLEERRMYHRKDGKIVKLQDDLISALIRAVMAKRFARQVHLGPVADGEHASGPRRTAKGTNFDLFTGS